MKEAHELNRFRAVMRLTPVLALVAVLMAGAAGCSPSTEPSNDGEISGSFNIIG